MFLLATLVAALSFGSIAFYSFAFAAFHLALVAVTTIRTRQLLMPAINRAADSGQRRRLPWLHYLSVVIERTHTAVAGFVLVRMVGQ